MRQPQRLQHQLQRNLFPNQPMTLVSVILGIPKMVVKNQQKMINLLMMNHLMLVLKLMKKQTQKNSLNNLLEN
jgi:hypothetical protein